MRLKRSPRDSDPHPWLGPGRLLLISRAINPFNDRPFITAVKPLITAKASPDTKAPACSSALPPSSGFWGSDSFPTPTRAVGTGVQGRNGRNELPTTPQAPGPWDARASARSIAVEPRCARLSRIKGERPLPPQGCTPQNPPSGSRAPSQAQPRKHEEKLEKVTHVGGSEPGGGGGIPPSRLRARHRHRSRSCSVTATPAGSSGKKGVEGCSEPGKGPARPWHEEEEEEDADVGGCQVMARPEPPARQGAPATAHRGRGSSPPPRKERTL